MGELKPCPFCGEAAEMDTQQAYRNISTSRMETAVAVYCTGCSAQVMICRGDVPDIEPEAVAELWNTRPRTEGRGEGKPVAWAYEYTNHLKGDRAPGGWLRAVAFEAPSRARVNAGFARNVQPLYASPIREPEISREAISAEADLVVRNVNEYDDRTSPEDWPEALLITSEELHAELMDFADAILNLAHVGGREVVSASDRAFVRHLILEMRSAIADDPNDATITTGPLDPDILERVLNVALGAQGQGGMK